MMRLPRQPRHTPTGDDTLGTRASGDTDDVDHLVLVEDIRDLHLLFEEIHDEVNLLLRAASIDLDLLDVGLLLTDLHLPHLRVANGADHLAVLLRPGYLSGHGRTLRPLARVAPPLLVLG